MTGPRATPENSSKSVEVFAIDDHPVALLGIERIFAKATDVRLIGAASTLSEAVGKISRATFDALVVEFALAGNTDLRLLRFLHEAAPQVPILVFSCLDEDVHALRLLQGGARGFVSKRSPPTDLLDGIRQVANGHRYLSRRLRETLKAAGSGDRERVAHENLSPREFTMLQLLARGQAPREIADAMGVSINTVSTYRARVMKKLALDTNAALMRYALIHRLVVD